jgi:hypothetical protein
LEVKQEQSILDSNFENKTRKRGGTNRGILESENKLSNL